MLISTIQLANFSYEICLIPWQTPLIEHNKHITACDKRIGGFAAITEALHQQFRVSKAFSSRALRCPYCMTLPIAPEKVGSAIEMLPTLPLTPIVGYARSARWQSSNRRC